MITVASTPFWSPMLEHLRNGNVVAWGLLTAVLLFSAYWALTGLEERRRARKVDEAFARLVQPDGSLESDAPSSSDRRHSYQYYSGIPWYRRSPVNSAFLLLGLFVPPLLWWVCINLITGDVYYDRRRADGRLRTWSRGNTIAAWLVLFGQCLTLYHYVVPAVLEWL